MTALAAALAEMAGRYALRHAADSAKFAGLVAERRTARAASLAADPVAPSRHLPDRTTS